MNYNKYAKNVIFHIFSKYKMHKKNFFSKKTIVELRLDMFHYASNNIKAVGIFTTASLVVDLSNHGKFWICNKQK